MPWNLYGPNGCVPLFLGLRSPLLPCGLYFVTAEGGFDHMLKYYYYYGSIALCWALAAFTVS
jgi:hypothetical protein